jgi:hypothetical protein
MKTYSQIIGKTITSYTEEVDDLMIRCSDGTRFRMIPNDIYGKVEIDRTDGNWYYIVGHPVTKVEEEVKKGPNKDKYGLRTTYIIHTEKNSIDIHWYGSSDDEKDDLTVDFYQCE